VAAVPVADDVERMEFQLTLRRRGISDQAVLRAMDEVPREYFVRCGLYRERLCRPGPADRLRADDQPGPLVVAYMTEKLEVEPGTACWKSAPAPATRRRSWRVWRSRS